MPVKKSSRFPAQFMSLFTKVFEGMTVRVPFDTKPEAETFRKQVYNYRLVILEEIRSKIMLDEDGAIAAAMDAMCMMLGRDKASGGYEILCISRDSTPLASKLDQAMSGVSEPSKGFPSDFDHVRYTRRTRAQIQSDRDASRVPMVPLTEETLLSDE